MKTINGKQEDQNTMDKMSLLAIQYRGIFIHHFTEIEILFSSLISAYFSKSPEKQIAYEVFINEKVSFNRKKDIIFGILNQSYSDFLVSHPNFLGDTIKIMEFRNILAHSFLLTNLNEFGTFDENNLKFLPFKFMPEMPKEKILPFIKTINKELLKEHIEVLEKTQKICLELLKLLIAK